MCKPSRCKLTEQTFLPRLQHAQVGVEFVQIVPMAKGFADVDGFE
jgi:hypothetical protein